MKSTELPAKRAKADAAWETELAPSRLSMSNKDRVPYTETVPKAMAAWDAVMNPKKEGTNV